MLKNIVRVGSVMAALVIAAGCGGGSTGPNNSTNGTGTGTGTGYGDPGGPTDNACSAGTFCMRGAAFDPTTLTVAVNATVTWENGSGVLHHVVFTTPSSAKAVGAGAAGDIGDISSGSTQRKFDTAGKYDFHCTIHAGMNGSLTVQ